ncbi:unnamed protein product [Mytilus edulis]|uniref:Uncharacterized protein n=1 Tax=Mytilus edulis TaxID=6550 RepID=A0A8S3QC55_MYTED|nr:unnamed protein product [Mytilus edulis]
MKKQPLIMNIGIVACTKGRQKYLYRYLQKIQGLDKVKSIRMAIGSTRSEKNEQPSYHEDIREDDIIFDLIEELDFSDTSQTCDVDKIIPDENNNELQDDNMGQQLDKIENGNGECVKETTTRPNKKQEQRVTNSEDTDKVDSKIDQNIILKSVDTELGEFVQPESNMDKNFETNKTDEQEEQKTSEAIGGARPRKYTDKGKEFSEEQITKSYDGLKRLSEKIIRLMKMVLQGVAEEIPLADASSTIQENIRLTNLSK